MNRRQYEKRNFSQLIEPKHEMKEGVIFFEYVNALNRAIIHFKIK